MNLLTEEEREYLSNIIKPFRDRIEYIAKYEYYPDGQYIEIEINDDDVPLAFPFFEPDKYYKNMELYKQYTLEELGLWNVNIVDITFGAVIIQIVHIGVNVVLDKMIYYLIYYTLDVVVN